MAAMEELETLLQSLQALKPPGINKTKIDGITAKCVDNVQSNSIIVQKIVQQFRNSPVTHKLGVLYVIDAVTRQWMEKARAAGQAVSKAAAAGTYASGVQKVTDVLPSLITDLVQSAPDNQKEKISKLLDIWTKGQTFPATMLSGFKQQLSSPSNKTYTPPGSPPKTAPVVAGLPALTNLQNVAPPAQSTAPSDAGALLAALASIGQQQNVQTNPAPVAPPAAAPVFPFAQNVAPPPPPGFVPPPPPGANGQAFPPPPPGGNDMMQQLLGAIAAGMIPADQAMTLLGAIAQAQQQQQQQQGLSAVQASQQPPAPAIAQPPAQNNFQQDRFDQNGNRYRDRSRSPDYNRRRHSPDRRTPPNRRDSPTYGVYDPNAGAEGNTQNRNDRERGRGRGKNRGRGRDRDEFRQRTPPAQRRQPSPRNHSPRNNQSKFIEWDYSMPRDNIKVLSRTLFVGGAGGTEDEIRAIFSRFGKVQTCIVNLDKRHAFVKMVNRHDAIAAKEGMDNIQDPSALSKARQTRWGVGFGPRDCSDYNTGVSIIPISRLTDADRKWVVTAEYGGTGGRSLEGGMVLEEPDIEIGAGVSSKAISRRVPPADTGRGRGGHGHGGRGGFDNAPGRFRNNKQDRPPVQHEPRHISPRPEPAVAIPPTVPSFGFQLPGY